VVCAAASQAQLVVLAPTVSAVANELRIAVGTAGQARSVTAVAAIVTSLVMLARPAVRRIPPVGLTTAGAAVCLAGTGAVALAPGPVAFLAGHVLVGAGLAALLSVAFIGVAAFPAGERLQVTGWVAAGNALAWIVVAPIVGVLTDAVSWRVAESVPAAAALAALAAARWIPVGQSRVSASARAVLRDRSARRWAIAESIAYAAWTALLTYVGAYFVARQALGESGAGAILAAGAVAYALSATHVGRGGARYSSRRLVVGSAVAMAALIPLLLAGSRSVPTAVVLFMLVGAAAGVRTPASAALALGQLGGDAAVVMTARTGATQAGYLLGAAVGGPVIAVLGYPALGIALAAGLLASIGLLSPTESARGGSAPGDGGGRRGTTGAAADPELGVGVGQVTLDRALTEEEPPGDLRVGLPLRDQDQNPTLTRRQDSEPGILPTADRGS
jgi:predicted MFS family arabinose efflux permease